MKLYQVTVPISGYAVIDIEADDPDSAIDEALSKIDMENVESWEAHKAIVEGNIFRGVLNRANADLVEDLGD